jgi:hypothetical protein
VEGAEGRPSGDRSGPAVKGPPEPPRGRKIVVPCPAPENPPLDRPEWPWMALCAAYGDREGRPPSRAPDAQDWAHQGLAEGSDRRREGGECSGDPAPLRLRAGDPPGPLPALRSWLCDDTREPLALPLVRGSALDRRGVSLEVTSRESLSPSSAVFPGFTPEARRDRATEPGSPAGLTGHALGGPSDFPEDAHRTTR